MMPVPSDARPPFDTAGPRRDGAGAVALVAWVLVLIAGLAFLHNVGGPLSPPPLTEPGRLGRWLDQRQPAEAAVAVVRLLALGTAWYLLAVTVGGAAARLAGVRSLVRASDAVTVPVVRRLLTGALGVSLAAAVFTGGGGTAVADERTGAPAATTTVETMRRLPYPDGGEPAPPVASEEAPVQRPAAGGPPPTMRRLPAAAPSGDTPASSTPSSTAPSATAPSATAPLATAATTGDTPTTVTAAPASSPSSAGAPPLPVLRRKDPSPTTAPAGAATSVGRTWMVQPGDHFWSVAERVLTQAWNRGPTDAEIDPYWRAMVDANRAVLRDADNPDLLFPDQVITIPALPPITPAGG